MDLLRATVNDFKMYNLKEELEISNDVYEDLSLMLKKILKTERVSARQMEILRRHFEESVIHQEHTMAELREERRELKNDAALLEGCLIEFMDVIFNLKQMVSLEQSTITMQILDTLTQEIARVAVKCGIQETAQIGEYFDADVQEVVGVKTIEGDEGDGRILDILEMGYKRGTRLIKNAKIQVGRKGR